MKNSIYAVCVFLILFIALGLNAEVVQISNSRGQAELPVILILKNGDIMIIYSEGHHYNQDATLYYTIYSKTKKSWSEHEEAVKKVYSSSYAQLAMDEEGDVHMSYMEGNSSSNRDIFYAMYDYKNSRWNSSHRAYESSGVNSSWPRIQVEDGKIYIVWSHNYEPSVGEMDVTMIVNDKEGTWPVPRKERKTVSNLAMSVSIHNSFQVRNKNIYCVWMDDNHKPGNWNMYYNEGKYNGTKKDWDWGNALRLFPVDVSQYFPALALDDAGDVHIVFSGKYGPFWYAKKTGNSWSQPKAISSGGTSQSLIAFLKFKQGLLHTVWRKTTANGEALFYGRALPDGTWANPVKIADCQSPGYPGLDVDNEGNVHVVWSDGPLFDDEHRNIFYTKVVLPGLPPEAVLNASPNMGLIPLKVTFDASGSSDPDGKIIDYRWDFGDGIKASGKTVTHVYNQRGKYTVTLNVIDDDMRVGTAKTVIAASEGEPFASFEASATTGMIPFTVMFDASSSSDVDGDIVSYHWDFGDGATSEGEIVTHTYESGGTFTATLTVTDNDGKTDSASMNLIVYQKPTAEFEATPTLGIAPLEVSLDASSSFDVDGNIVSYHWDFGDGITGQGQKVTHTYSTPGNFIVVLTLEDNDGYTGIATKLIQVLDKPLAPENVRVEIIPNKSLFYVDYINKITWEENPDNSGLFTVVQHRIYRKIQGETDAQFVQVGEVDGNTFQYEDRKFSSSQEAARYVYVVTAVDDKGNESPYSQSGKIVAASSRGIVKIKNNKQ